MLKLSKYELLKNFRTLPILLGGLAALEIWFLWSVHQKSEGAIFGSIAVLFLYAMVCFFAVFIFAVTNYYREINSKTSYLVFMTPVSPLGIIISKMLTVLFIGVILGGILIGLGIWDITLLGGSLEEFKSLKEELDQFFSIFGTVLNSYVLNIVLSVVIFLLAFFAMVSMVYFCITLVATLMANNRFRAVLSAALFLLLAIGRQYLQNLLPSQEAGYSGEITFSLVIRQSTPYALLNLATIIVMVAATSWLLKHRLSL